MEYRGFTLIEVIIAFAIFSLASVAMYNSMSVISSMLVKLSEEGLYDNMETSSYISNTFYNIYTDKYSRMDKLNVGFERRFVDCKVGDIGKSIVFYDCPYETFNVVNISLPETFQGVRQVIVLGKVSFLFYKR